MLNYHTTLDNKELTKECKVVQIMLSGYRRPSSRTIESFCPWGIKQKVVIHMDYYRPVSRYAFMTEAYRKALMEELKGILTVNPDKIDVLGVVMHTDTIFSSAFLKDCNILIQTRCVLRLADFEFLCAKHLTSKMYMESNKLAELMFLQSRSSDADELLVALETAAVGKFVKDLEEALGQQETYGRKIFLENTVKNLRGKSYVGTLSQFEKLAGLSRYVGICLDTEHAYASGWWNAVKDIDVSKADLVHLNTIPKDIEAGSYKDRHSVTTLTESKFEAADYLNLLRVLEGNAIPYVREVHEDTIIRECQQLQYH